MWQQMGSEQLCCCDSFWFLILAKKMTPHLVNAERRGRAAWREVRSRERWPERAERGLQVESALNRESQPPL